MTCTQVIEYHSKQLVGILKQELELEKAALMEKLHLRTLERIFVEERIYKKIENQKTEEGVIKAVMDGFKPFKAELIRPITVDDVDHLLKIPIRRISLYDMNKNKQEVQAINDRIKEINRLLKHLVDYAICGYFIYVHPKIPFTNISIPIAIRIIPPTRYAFPASFVPTFLPITIPHIHMIKVSIPMIAHAVSAVVTL